MAKFVKDGAHNRYAAYCCEDIDAQKAELEAKIEELDDLGAGIVPDGSVTLAKLADDARSYTREINKGALLCEWIGTKAEYAAHISANGGAPVANCRYTITDDAAPAYVTAPDVPVGSIVIALLQTELNLFETVEQLYKINGVPYAHAEKYLITGNYTTLDGTWIFCGYTSVNENLGMFQKISAAVG